MLSALDIEQLVPLFLEEASKEDKKKVLKMFRAMQEAYNDICLICDGWGCTACCGSDAEIRSRQGTFG